MRTVDLVIAGDGVAAREAAVGALQRGQRVLVVVRSAARAGLRSRLLLSSGARADQLRVVTSAKVVCVDGLAGVEAVVVRHARTGRLSAVNTSAFLSPDGLGDGNDATCCADSPGCGARPWRYRTDACDRGQAHTTFSRRTNKGGDK